MKRLIKTLIAIASIAMIFSCTGEDGEDGRDGINAAEATIFEIEDVNFISNDGLSASVIVTADEGIDIIQSDVALLFVLDPLESAENGVDVWEPLPRTFFFDDGGQAQFRFNFIFDEDSNIFDIEITLESNNFDNLDSFFTDDQIFRIAVIPASNVNSFASQASSSLLFDNIDESSIIKINN